MAKKGAFSQNLGEIERVLDRLAGPEAGRVVEWTINSSAWKVLKEIRKPESQGGWPIDTKTSWKKWGFERIKRSGGRVTFGITNDATPADRPPPNRSTRSRWSSVGYVPFVYAKGDGAARRPIAPRIVKRAILSARGTLEKNYFERLNRILEKRRRHGR